MKYSSRLAGTLRDIQTVVPTNNSDLRTYTQTIQSTVIKIFTSSCPHRLPQNKNKSTPWWCPELEQDRKLAIHNASNSKLEDDWDIYKVHFMEYKKVFRQKQRKTWRTYCGEIETFPQDARFQRVLPTFTVKSENSKKDATSTSNLQESMQLLREIHFVNSMPTYYNGKHLHC